MKEIIGNSCACVSRGSPGWGLNSGWAISSAARPPHPSGTCGIEMPPLKEPHGEAGQAASPKNVNMWKPQGPCSGVFFCPIFASANTGWEMGWLNGWYLGQESCFVVVSDCTRCIGIMMPKVWAFTAKYTGLIRPARGINQKISDWGRRNGLAVSLPNNLYQAKKKQVASSLDGMEK